ncbi:T9SS type A sorting domain-containing protein [Croceimicrobium sp.]|uniref:T9SS type A sorting domain-containing protein n=1 Tax=Croceimicrobium sp. TaxID=2828340 RepID=UPI003BA95A7B
MRKIYLTLFSSFIALGLNAQSSASFDLNNIECGLSPNGGLFEDDSYWGDFKIKNAQDKAVLFAGHLWLAGFINDSLRTAVQEYHLYNDPDYNQTDFRFGPIADSYSDPDYQNNYARVWKMAKSMIDHHIQHWQDQGYSPLTEILEWPAHGDTTNGEAWLLAPFADLNGNKVYEPLSGEYPIIRGDQSLYCIFNDEDRYTPRSDLRSLGVEVHLELYGFDPTAMVLAENAVFLNYKIINRSNKDIDSLYAGQWYDSDLGFSFDDICGSDSSLALSYTYNADSLDEGIFGFGFNPPAVGFSMLQGNPSGAMYYHNIGGYMGPIETTDPQIQHHWLNYLNNRWQNAEPLRIENPSGLYDPANGDGYEPISTNPITQWAFNDSKNWYCSPIETTDKRQLINHQKVNLKSGDSLCFDLMINYARDFMDMNPWAAVSKLKFEQQSLAIFWANQNYGCHTGPILSLTHPKSLNLKVYPNPAQNVVSLEWSNDAELNYQLVNSQGQLIKEGQLLTDNRQIDLSELNKGVYFLIVQNSQGYKQSIKLLKA